MDDDGTMANRIRRDGGSGADRGGSQTHGAGDASGVDADPDVPQMRFSDSDDDAEDDATPASPSEAASS